MQIALVQLPVYYRDPVRNQVYAGKSIYAAATHGAQVVLLPELWAVGYDFPAGLRMASRLDEGPFGWMATWAREARVWVGGSHLERGDDGIYNTFALYAPDGRRVAAYRKIHLFGPLGEPRWLRAGMRPVLAPTPWGPIGLAVCYDLRFPELFRVYAQQGAVAIWVVAAWPRARIEHWRQLLRARALENARPVVGVNRVGMDVSAAFGGASMAVAAEGTLLAEAPVAQAHLLHITLPLGDAWRTRRAFDPVRESPWRIQGPILRTRVREGQSYHVG
ncbi:MAG: carbon-nitrogen family hydrolase [Chloroflexi bacterium]|nr:carbon-nitrogen family hydrolase [Chloroflexota bacterium]